jgi:hypothetical protein
MDEATRRKAENEALFREVNERIEDLRHHFAVTTDDALSILCECDRIDCDDRLDVPPPAYERVRSDATCFFVAPGHENPAVEDVVDSAGDYLIVRKHPGEPAEFAVETDPRS